MSHLVAHLQYLTCVDGSNAADSTQSGDVTDNTSMTTSQNEKSDRLCCVGLNLAFSNYTTTKGTEHENRSLENSGRDGEKEQGLGAVVPRASGTNNNNNNNNNKQNNKEPQDQRHPIVTKLLTFYSKTARFSKTTLEQTFKIIII